MKNLRQLREAVNLTQAQLGEAVGVHQACVCQWEHGRCKPLSKRWKLLAKTLGVDLEVIIRLWT